MLGYQDARGIAGATVAYAAGNCDQVVEIMSEVRYRMVQLGGSWAQRDRWQRLSVDAAKKAGRCTLARALLVERVDTSPRSAPSRKLYDEALDRCGRRCDTALAGNVRKRI